ncbi:methyltransferase domain-containing protein [Bradyrhizobium sp. CCGB12]|uniref:methyltransferase domain-containing protein n=1 Tax=Bradyrhizobium sp. CCGB12 TaxID=2949632 RepID=UPI0020B17E93|nr:methyltransferase domain-containing protein [Bradyrhizobium sp. CCGB12]MCP3392309.1 methyltransferase domain-containing protein [Bradyrhizobium sp. CCGB12]
MAKQHVVRKRVLDIACGEGYGSFFMKSWGASSVHGIDLSTEAVTAAQSQFAAPGISFDQFDATRIDEKFSAGEFDVIVSLETIEHVNDPEAYLTALKKVAKPNAVFVISCPNDHWYYPDSSSGNPYHKRKYSIGEFQALTSRVLGPEVQWLIGSAMIGFGTVRVPSRSSSTLVQVEMVEGTEAGHAAIVPGKPGEEFGPRTCSYFVGIWGAQGAQPQSTAAFPISMDSYAVMMGAEDRIGVLQSELDQRTDELRRQIEMVKEAGSDIAALRLQLEATIRQRDEQLAELRIERDRYRIKSVALQREIEILGEKVQEGKSELTTCRVQHQVDVGRLEKAIADAHASFELVDEQLQQRVSELDVARSQSVELLTDRDRYRIKNLALQRESEIVVERLQVATSRLATTESRYQADVQKMAMDAHQLREMLSNTQAERESYIAQVASLERELEATSRRTPKGLIRRAARGAKPMIPKAAMPLLIGAAKRLKF